MGRPSLTARGAIIAAASSGSGKTTVTLALLALLTRRGHRVASCKVGPDYIDPAFHALATRRACYNLDSWAMRPQTIATLTARAGQATASHPVEIVANPVTQVAVEPATASVRVGDVVRLRFVARDRSGKVVADATPEWSLAPGRGIIDPDGAFVAEQAGTHRVVASFAGRSAEAVIEARPRDAVPRPLRGVPVESESAGGRRSR